MLCFRFALSLHRNHNNLIPQIDIRYEKDFIGIIILFGIISCNTKSTQRPNSNSRKIDSIYLQPYQDFSIGEANNLVPRIQKGLNKVYGNNFIIKVLPQKSIPKSAFYAPRNRYLANVLLTDLNCNSNVYIIGLTHKDISYAIHGFNNYGIMGLTSLGKNKSIVSDYRVGADDFIAVILHEFGHGYYSAKHCTNPKCIMCDYQKHKGKPFVYKLCKEHSYMK